MNVPHKPWFSLAGVPMPLLPMHFSHTQVRVRFLFFQQAKLRIRLLEQTNTLLQGLLRCSELKALQLLQMNKRGSEDLSISTYYGWFDSSSFTHTYKVGKSMRSTFYIYMGLTCCPHQQRHGKVASKRFLINKTLSNFNPQSQDCFWQPSI